MSADGKSLLFPGTMGDLSDMLSRAHQQIGDLKLRNSQLEDALVKRQERLEYVTGERDEACKRLSETTASLAECRQALDCEKHRSAKFARRILAQGQISGPSIQDEPLPCCSYAERLYQDAEFLLFVLGVRHADGRIDVNDSNKDWTANAIKAALSLSATLNERCMQALAKGGVVAPPQNEQEKA